MGRHSRASRYKLHLARGTTDHPRIDVDLAQRTLISSARLRHGVIVDGRGCRPSSSSGSVKNSRDLSRVTIRSSQHTAGRVLIAGRRQRVARSRFDRFHRLSRTHRARARQRVYVFHLPHRWHRRDSVTSYVRCIRKERKRGRDRETRASARHQSGLREPVGWPRGRCARSRFQQQSRRHKPVRKTAIYLPTRRPSRLCRQWFALVVSLSLSLSLPPSYTPDIFLFLSARFSHSFTSCRVGGRAR